MDKKSKIFIGMFLLLVLISVVITFFRYIVKKDIVFFTDEQVFNESLLKE